MNKFAITVYLIVFCIICNINHGYAQNFVTDPKSFVTGHLDSLGINYTFSTNAEGLEYLYFQDGVFEIHYVFNKNDYCVNYKIIFPKEGFETMIKGLSDAFEKISDNQWQEFDGREFFIWSYVLQNDRCIITVQSKIALDLGKKE